MSQKVAIVTGSNKGIGYAIVKGLCEKYNGIVYLTSRSISGGQSAVESLKKLGLNPRYHQLDIDDEKSVKALSDYIKEKYGGFDLLVNNAGIAFANDATESVSYQAEHTVKTNYFGTLRICNALFPLLRQNGVVVNVSSLVGHLSRIPGEHLRRQFSDPELTVDKLNQLMNQFIKDTKEDKHKENGWGNSTYAVSKVGVSALTRIQQRLFDSEKPYRNISVNDVHPGYVDTDMSNHKGPLTIEQGASAPLFLALESHGLKGEYVWEDKKVYDWYADTPQPKA